MKINNVYMCNEQGITILGKVEEVIFLGEPCYKVYHGDEKLYLNTLPKVSTAKNTIVSFAINEVEAKKLYIEKTREKIACLLKEVNRLEDSIKKLNINE